MHTINKALGLLSITLLHACGGGGGAELEPSPSPQPTALELPATALASDEGMTRFALGLAVSDGSEALAVDEAAALPASDTSEPTALD